VPEDDRNANWLRRRRPRGLQPDGSWRLDCDPDPPFQRMLCPWGDHETEAERLPLFRPDACMPTDPWRWWCPDCEMPIPTEDARWEEFAGIAPEEWLQQLNDQWQWRQGGST
jgi:hypothetical protein